MHKRKTRSQSAAAAATSNTAPNPVAVPSPPPSQAAPSKKMHKKATAATTGKTSSTTTPTAHQQNKKEEAVGSAAAPSDAQVKRKDRLHAFLLSPAASTESELVDGKAEEVKPLSPEQITAILDKFAPHHRRTMDRLGAVPVSQYILSTYQTGLPNFASNPPLQQHTIRCIRTVFDKVPTIVPADARMCMGRLVDAYTACQAEQGRVIDSLYGILSGRDKGLREQCLTLVDELKQRVLDELTRGGDAHTQNGYRLSLGKELGLRGLASAASDRLAIRIHSSQAKQQQIAAFRAKFSVDDLVDSMIFDVNQQDIQAQRIIDRTVLCAFALSEGCKQDGFDAHSIYYDPEVRGGYHGQPTDKNKFQPFLNRDVALEVLLRVFEM